MALARSNFGAKHSQDTPVLLQDKVVLDRLAAVGSFIFVKAGSLYQAAQELGVDVKTG